ncbi:SEC-C motif-containing protein [Microbacterium endophyticum]|uniref:SEC-C motif-containing protein n=1 Tax=Microbacterium endophyticum TaxID=1526412 RepID=A0A7W4V4Y7_9MICO|nr:YchJ family metal-binding protein [Microbacterium endophyticum]MBB2976799.1 SEC-C motif-containing protein [Microbacterium endophyticum]NIK36564.1 SEC-C motif-containing protein [Microbacterium endophyticum]
MKDADLCACGSQLAFAECCGPVIGGSAAPTAEALMRSRYTAFALGNRRHLMESWHPGTRPADLDFDDRTVWTGLDISCVEAGKPGDRRGFVTFRAHWRDAKGRGTLSERSRFVWQSERWWYLDGDATHSAE